ncbi:MAG: DUF1549 domain-containing protein [Planctomycetaceae bacterium]|nr:DUF1549 domain-containing protein [Planctomycetaceae bacterium]
MLRSLAAVAGLSVFWGLTAAASAQESLAARIDAQIAAKAGGPLAARSTDAEFVRRAYLDFAGRIPSATEAREFVADASADKRSKLVSRLLESPEYAHRMSQAFHVMLMERLGDDATWEAYLRASFAANKPWDQLAREILNPDADNEATRPAGHFLSKRLENYGQNAIDFPGLTRDVGRLFLGVDLQCAQCHNHPLIDDYKQHDFQGLFVVYSNLTRRTDVKFPAVSEKALLKKLEFQSVFTSEKGATGPRMPFGMEFELVTFKPGEEYSIPPDKKANKPGKLKFSPLQVIAENLVKSDNHYFARNAVNRLWFLMMGRGLYHPLDLDHSKNLASHPELLDLLAQEFVSHQFNIKWFLQELAASETYQRSGVLPEGVVDPDPARFSVAIERPLSAEQMLRSMLEATGERSRLEPPTPGDKPAAVTIEPPLPKYEDLAKRVTVAFASTPRDPEIEFAPTLKGALFVMNSEPFLSLLKKRSGNLVDRCVAMSEAEKVADELYQSILARPPVESERAEVAAYLASHAADREKAIGQLAWALLASTEFCTNH